MNKEELLKEVTEYIKQTVKDDDENIQYIFAFRNPCGVGHSINADNIIGSGLAIGIIFALKESEASRRDKNGQKTT